ncbi:MAG TPA: LuxR C-terminal-related transcriptional regulator, partial [Thermomonospora sp.]|nr:LuxR C-terminal-related transcriptional regulator [Thermomonospora sp.]
PRTEIVAALRHAAVAPGSFTAAGLAQALARRRSGELLSPRERQVLTLLMDGRSIAAIASTMHLSHSTAKTYTARLYEKLGAANRTQAVMAALRMGLIRQDQELLPPAACATDSVRSR